MRSATAVPVRYYGGMLQDLSYPDPWPAPVARKPLNALVQIPGSKSLSNRYLLLAALGTQPVTLVGLLRSRDTDLMMDALRQLGVGIDIDSQNETTVTVTPPPNGVFAGNTRVFCGLAGTVMRFVPALALFADGPVTFDGDEQAYARPMKPLLDGLTQLGDTVTYHGREGFLPFTLTPAGSSASEQETEHTVAIDASGSSQFISGILLVAARVSGGLTLRHTGQKLPSIPHIRMTVSDIELAGAKVEADYNTGTWTVVPSKLQLPAQVVVEPDLSNAAPFLGAALIAGGSVSVPYWPAHTTQPGGLIPGLYQRMGAQVTWGGKPLTADGMPDCDDLRATATLCVQGGGVGSIQGLGTCDLSAAGEVAPTIAALAVLAESPSQLVGIAHLRGHETNRLSALVEQIQALGVSARELEDGIAIDVDGSQQLHGRVMQTYADHRMATFAAMIGLAVEGIEIENIATTRKTIPDFVGLWQQLFA